ncbi:MAG: MFS transporter [Devosia nanyangense]|uniref:MFS transporter n=1 Tax=Devosia nanyangense TaxID=1228055 RepID=A0A933L060_9HYPH|nr:MFS transporter [Devosia nanyangense]
MPLAVFALALAAFCIGTTEFIISGILLSVSTDLAVTVPTAGLLVTGYAAGVAVGGPLLGLLLTRVPLKPAILGVMVIFALGQLLCAFAPTYQLLLGARLVSACGHGVFFGVASVAVSHLVPPARRGAALSLFVGGITVANILGLPGGTAIGNMFGWRVAFVCIAALALLSVVAVAFALPGRVKGEGEADAPLALQARQLLDQEVWLSYLIIAIIMVGQLAFGTFQVAILTNVTAIDLRTTVPLFLLIGGAGAVLGIWLGGKGADWSAGKTILIVIAGQIACFAVLLVAVHNPVTMAIMLFVSSLFGFGFSTPIQVRILHGARAAPRLAATLVSTAYNVGIAAGAFLGAVLLNAGIDYALLPAAGIVSSALAGVVAIVSLQLSRRTSTTLSPIA